MRRFSSTSLQRSSGATVAVLGLLLVGGPAAAQSDQSITIDRPGGANRVVEVFDFEEAERTLEPVPMHWVRTLHLPERGVKNPGFPRWNDARFDNSHSVSGAYSVMLPTRGGSTALRLASGVVPAIPGADYAVSTHLRTAGLEHAKARLVARLLDDHNQAISGAETASPLHVSDDGWTRVEVLLPGRFPDAAWIQIELQVLQPDVFEDADPPAHVARLEDVNGAAWFDDVLIRQTPRISLGSNNPINIIVAPERPTITTTIRDLTGETLTARVIIRDIDGRLIDTREITVPRGARSLPWTPDLPEYGWYNADLRVRGESDEIVGERRLDFVWAAERSRKSGPDADRFAIIADSLPTSHSGFLPELVSRLGSGAITLAAWTPDLTPERIDEHTSAMAPVVESLLSAGQAVTMIFSPPPESLHELARRGGVSVNRLLADDPEVVNPYVAHIVARFGQRVRRWRLGTEVETPPLDADELSDAAVTLTDLLTRLAPDPTPVAPWNASQALPEGLTDVTEIALDVPATFQSPHLEHLADALPGVGETTLSLELLDPVRFGRRAGAVELARRVIRAWRIEPGSIAIDAPWRAEHFDDDATIEPTANFAVYRNLVDRLAMRRVVGSLPIGFEAVALILEGPGPDAIVAWRHEPGGVSTESIETYLSDKPVEVVDIFGNRRVVEAVDGAHRIKITDEPTFIEGIDVNLARFRAGFSVDPQFISSTASEHTLRLGVSNPWPSTISGRLRIVEPEHWRLAPRVIPFNIPSEARQTFDFTASFGVGEEAGPATFVVEFDLMAEQRYPLIRVADQVEIGLPTVQLAPSYRIERNDEGELADLSVTLLITNVSDKPQTLTAFAMAPGHPRKSAPISEMPPNQSIVKRFFFPDAAKTLRGRSIRVGLTEIHGFGRLNKTVYIE